MKKTILLSIFVILASISFADDDDNGSQKRLGNVGAYEKTFTISYQDCLNNIGSEEIPATSLSCNVSILKDSDDKIQIPNKAKRTWLDIIKENPIEREKYKDAKVRITVTANITGYSILMESFIVRNGNIVEFGPRITLLEFENFIKQYIEKMGNTFAIQFLKIEKD